MIEENSSPSFIRYPRNYFAQQLVNQSLQLEKHVDDKINKFINEADIMQNSLNSKFGMYYKEMLSTETPKKIKQELKNFSRALK